MCFPKFSAKGCSTGPSHRLAPAVANYANHSSCRRLPPDPNTLELGLGEGQSAEEQRIIVKQLVLTALNAKDRKSAVQSFVDSFPTDQVGEKTD